MALNPITESNYVIKSDLKKYTASVLALLAQRDTKITGAETRLDALELLVDELECGLFYAGKTTVEVTTAKDGALVYWDNVTLSDSTVRNGWWFYSETESKWIELGSGSGISDDDICKVPDDDINFATEITL